MAYFRLANCAILWNVYRKSHGPSGKPSKVDMAIFSNIPYGEIASDSQDVQNYDLQLSSAWWSMPGAWVYGGMPMCRVGTAMARRSGGTVAHQVSWLCTRCHGCAPGVTAAHQMARQHGCGMFVTGCRVGLCGRWQGGIVARWHGLLVTWLHGGTEGLWNGGTGKWRWPGEWSHWDTITL